MTMIDSFYTLFYTAYKVVNGAYNTTCSDVNGMKDAFWTVLDVKWLLEVYSS